MSSDWKDGGIDRNLLLRGVSGVNFSFIQCAQLDIPVHTLLTSPQAALSNKNQLHEGLILVYIYARWQLF